MERSEYSIVKISAAALICGASFLASLSFYKDGVYAGQVVKSVPQNIALQALFTDTIPAPKENSMYKEFFLSRDVKDHYPWLYNNFYKLNHEQSEAVIRKWSSDVKISLGYPNNLKPYSQDAESQEYMLYIPDYVATLGPQDLARIKGDIATTSKELSDLTGLKINYLDPIQETENLYGNLRIVFVKDTLSWETSFKKGNVQSGLDIFGGAKAIQFRDAIEKNLRNIVWYTPSTLDQVDGYYLSDSSNNIYFGSCYIWTGHAHELQSSLIYECIARALGVPGLVESKQKSVFSNWSTSHQGGYPSVKDDPLGRLIIKTLYSSETKSGLTKKDFTELLQATQREKK